MYLALIPNDKSSEAICSAVPAATELHLTVIHSKCHIPPDPTGVVRSYAAHIERHGITAHVRGTIRVGPTGRRLWAIGLYQPGVQSLEALRKFAEDRLRDAGMNWSSQWPFSPHITLCAAPVLSLADELPTTVVFNKLEWRP